MFISCAGQDTRSILDEGTTADITQNEIDSAILADNTDSTVDPDLVNDDQTDPVDTEMPDSMIDQMTSDDMIYIDIENEIDQTIDIDQMAEDDTSTDPDYGIDQDQFETPDEVNQVDHDIPNYSDETDPVDLNGELDEINTVDENTSDDLTMISEVEVNINAFPQEVDVHIECGDFIYDDTTPFVITLPVGTCEFTFSKEGYQTEDATHDITAETTTVSEILQPLPDILVSFISDPPEVEVCIDDQFCNFDAQITEFTTELPPNSDHVAYCSKQGYYDLPVEFHVGEEPMEVSIVMTPISYQDYCGWLGGTFGFVSGTIPPVENVDTYVEVFDDHCMVCGFEPPSPEGVCLYGEYSTLYDIFYMDCPSSMQCLYIHCLTYPGQQLVDCTFEGAEGDNENIQWFKLN